MSICFGSVEEATSYALAGLGLTAEEGFSLEQIETEPVGTFGSDLLIERGEAPDASDEERATAERIKSTGEQQQTFRIMKDGKEHEFPPSPNGETTPPINITVGPFRDGFDCWIVNTGTGMGFRL